MGKRESAMCSQTLRGAGRGGRSEGAGMTTAPAGKRLLRLKKLSTTQRNARERRASRLKPCAGTSAAAMKKLRTPSRSRLKKLSFRSRLKKLRSTQGSASERRASCLKPCSRRRSWRKRVPKHRELREKRNRAPSKLREKRKRAPSRLEPAGGRSFSCLHRVPSRLEPAGGRSFSCLHRAPSLKPSGKRSASTISRSTTRSRPRAGGPPIESSRRRQGEGQGEAA